MGITAAGLDSYQYISLLISLWGQLTRLIQSSVLLSDPLDEIGEFIRYGLLANPSSLEHTIMEGVVFKKVDHFERRVMVCI